MSTTAPRTPRLRLTLQPVIVKLYKLAGIVALGAILIGLLLYLINNVFYFFDNTWVRRVILSPRHVRVVEAAAELSAAEQRLAQLEVEQARTTAELAKLDRVIASSQKFELDMGAVIEGAGHNLTAVGPRRELDRAQLEREAATGDKLIIERHLRELENSIADQKGVVDRLSSSFYLKGRSGKIVVGFVPYANLGNARPGTTLYRCKWGLINCWSAGKVVSVLDGEVTERHPHRDETERGVMIELELTDPSAGEDNVLFAGSKPFWLF